MKSLNFLKEATGVKTVKTHSSPAIAPRFLPSGPEGPGRFGAYYTKQKYYWEWDVITQ